MLSRHIFCFCFGVYYNTMNAFPFLGPGERAGCNTNNNNDDDGIATTATATAVCGVYCRSIRNPLRRDHGRSTHSGGGGVAAVAGTHGGAAQRGVQPTLVSSAGV